MFDNVAMRAATVEIMTPQAMTPEIMAPSAGDASWDLDEPSARAAIAAAARTAPLPFPSLVPAKSAPDRVGALKARGLAEVFDDGAVRTGEEIGADGGILPDAGLLPVLPALRDLLPAGGLQHGSVTATGGWSLLCLALAAGAATAGAWCAAAGLPDLGVRAAADAGLDPGRLLLVNDLGQNWPHAVVSLLDGCDLVLLRPPDRPSAQVRRKLEAAVRRFGTVLLVVGDWKGASARLRVIDQRWVGVGYGHGRLRARLAKVAADGRGAWSRPRTRWLWLPGPDGSVSVAEGSAVTGEPGPWLDDAPDASWLSGTLGPPDDRWLEAGVG
jgi:hypothetical protein